MEKSQAFYYNGGMGQKQQVRKTSNIVTKAGGVSVTMAKPGGIPVATAKPGGIPVATAKPREMPVGAVNQPGRPSGEAASRPEKARTETPKNPGELPADLASAFTKPKKQHDKAWLVFLIVGLVGLAGGITCLLLVLLRAPEERSALDYPEIPLETAGEEVYSDLTGEVLPSADLKTAPVYCIQTPNGMDGARPQAGLNRAGVIFEAIAEAGITRFAAIYQDPTSAIIGPIRSLRIYYLEWDTPFDCTIVHAGGSGDALAAVSSGGYRDLTEDYTYMYRGTAGARRWNNLFTTSAQLRQFNSDKGYNSSEIKGFARMTPTEAKKAQIDGLVSEKLNILKAATGSTEELNAPVANIGLRFGGIPSFNVNYTYDATSNTYLRSYENGNAHEVYNCPAEDLGERNPEDTCSLVQMAPSVVVAMVVNEHIASDNYHEDIAAIGAGDAYVFQNGTVTQGTWSKSTRDEQITFKDKDGHVIKLAPGQTIISAIPGYGSVAF